jgi:hypothetical protein
VRIARALPCRILTAFRDGELSYSKVRAITRIADRNNEAELVELARPLPPKRSAASPATAPSRAF